jgi:iron complex transport system substrate-binding protein
VDGLHTSLEIKQPTRSNTMKFRDFSILMLTALALIGVVPLAAQDAPEGFPLTIVDGAGRELTFDAPPQRVVTYYNDSYGMLATLDLMPVAQRVNPEMLTDPIYFAGAGRDIPTIPGSDAPDLEAVAAAQPDLVMVYSVEEADALEGIAPAFVTYDPATLDDLYEAVQQYGLLFARQETASAAVTAFQQRLAAYISLAPRSVTVLKLGAMDAGAFYISTIDDPICQILNMLAICEWEKATPDEFWGYETTLEGVLELDPDVILLNNWSSASREDMLAALDTNSLWNELSAVQAGRVVGTPGYENPIASSLPAATKFLDTYLPLIYPTIFPAPLTDEQVQEILAGEAAASDAQFPVTVVDGLGREVTLSERPERVVATSTLHLFDLLALGIIPVGTEIPPPFLTTDDEAEALRGLLAQRGLEVPEDVVIPAVNNLDWSVDWERVAALQPDLIVVYDIEAAQIAEGIAPAYSVYASRTDGVDDLEMMENAFLGLGRVLGRETEAKAYLQQMRDRVAAYEALAPGNRTALMIYSGGDGSFDMMGAASLTCQLWEDFAPCAAPGSATDYWMTGSTEALLAENPDTLLILGPCYGDSCEEVNTALVAALAEQPLWNELAAVREGRIHVLPYDPRTYSAATLGQLYDVTAPLIYPEVFPAPLTDEQVQEIVNG